MMRNQSWPALAKTGGMMASAGGTFAAIGGIYAGVACASEGVRGKADFWNGVVGGLAAGQVVGVRGRSLGLGRGSRGVLRSRVGGGGCRGVQGARRRWVRRWRHPRARLLPVQKLKREGERERGTRKGASEAARPDESRCKLHQHSHTGIVA